MVKKFIIYLLSFSIIISGILHYINVKQNKYIPTNTEEKIDSNIDENVYKIPYVPYKDRKSTIIHEYDGDDLRSLEGEKIYICFWTSYCNYCLKEFEALKKAQEKFSDMTFVLISHDKTKEELENFIKENPCNFFIIYNPSKSIRSKLNIQDKYIPSSYILDKNHEIIDQTNKLLSYEELIDFINH